MHAHKCAECAKSGISTIWLHGEECQGVLTAHTCPRCGSSRKENWRKFLVPVGTLPAQAAQVAQKAVGAISPEMYVLITVAAFLVSILALYMVKRFYPKAPLA